MGLFKDQLQCILARFKKVPDLSHLGVNVTQFVAHPDIPDPTRPAADVSYIDVKFGPKPGQMGTKSDKFGNVLKNNLSSELHETLVLRRM